MALSEFSDYMFHPKVTYVGEGGVGKGCLIGTKKYLLMVPLKVDLTDYNRTITTTTYKLGDDTIDVGIAKFLQLPDLTIEALEDFIMERAENIEISELLDLSAQKRVRVKNGWLSKGIYASEKENGPGWKGYPLNGKDVALKWIDFYKGLPNFVD